MIEGRGCFWGDFNWVLYFGMAIGNEKLGIGNNEQSRHASPSPVPNRKMGEFLRVTETSPLIEPTEVVVTSRDVQFAQPVISAHGTN